MNIHIFLFTIAILLGVLYLKQGNTSQNRKQYIIVFFSLLTAESCLRGLSVGSDTRAYYWTFTRYQYVEWNKIGSDFVARYLHNELTEDIGFGIYMKLVHLVSHNYSIFLFISALFFFIPFGILIYKYTDDIQQLIFIFVLYVALFNMIALSGVRKEIALGFAIWAFLYYVEEKYAWASIVLLIGATIHQSILLMLLVPVIVALPSKWILISHCISFFMIPLFIAFSGKILRVLGSLSFNERYYSYGLDDSRGGAITFLILIEIISLFCMISLNQQLLKADKPFFKKIYSMLPLFTLFATLIMNNGSMIRISQYFHLYILILLPKAIDSYFYNQDRKRIYIILVVFLILLTKLTTKMKYIFIWQDNIF